MEQYVNKYQKNLRCGITTGTCATAAAMAATSKLLLGIDNKEVTIVTPKNVKVQVAVFADDTYVGIINNNDNNRYESVSFYVIKDSGDDPDVTNQCKVYATVTKITDDYHVSDAEFYDDSYPNIYLAGGIGIGRVTKEGLEQEIGKPAINVVPRGMIIKAVYEVMQMAGYEGKLKVTISIPNGEELALKTFNPRLGIEGGLSILGTSGILEPMSEKAIVDTIETLIKQQASLGNKNLLVTPGNYGQGYVQDYFKMSLENSIKCSNYIGDTIDLAISYGMERFVLIGNVGKLCKLAAGIMNTHSKVADGRCEVFATHTALKGGSSELIAKIMNSITTEEILDILDSEGMVQCVMDSIMRKIDEVMAHRCAGKLKYAVYLFSEKRGFLGCTKDAEIIISEYKK